LQQLFGTLTNDMKFPKTPSPPGFHVVRQTTETSKIDDKIQKLFHSRVGMLLYLVEHLRPDLSNCIRELSKVMDGATTIQWNELLRVIKFASGTKETGLRMDLTNDEK
jgi:hypothetical protein